MSPALRQLVELLVELTIDDFLREQQQVNPEQRERNRSNPEEARARLDQESETRKRRLDHPNT
jgi:hypothetical protein